MTLVPQEKWVKSQVDSEQWTSEPIERPPVPCPISRSSEDAYSAYPSTQASSCSLESSNILTDLCGDCEFHVSVVCSMGGGVLIMLFLLRLLLRFLCHLSLSRRGRVHGMLFEGPCSTLEHTAFSLINTNRLVPGWPFRPMKYRVIQIFGTGKMRKTRGTGAYFPSPSTVTCSSFCFYMALRSIWIGELY